MAKIVIKDLAESLDLDRAAMSAISGGARLGGRQPFAVPIPQRGDRIIDYPGGFRSGQAAPARGRKPAK